MAANTIKELKDFFSTPEKPCSAAEFMEFWKPMTDEEREYYKNADLK